MLSQRQGAKGVTLIELMVGIAILTILFGIAVPNFRVWIQNGKVRTAAESIQNGLQVARVEAIQRNRRVQFDLRDGSSWTVCLQPTPAGSCPDPDGATTIQSRSADEGSSDAVTVDVEVGAVPIVFDPSGRAPGNAAEFLIDTTALAEDESRQLRVIVSTSGSIRMCEDTLPADDLRACPP